MNECGFGGLPPVVMTQFGQLLSGSTSMKRRRLFLEQMLINTYGIIGYW